MLEAMVHGLLNVFIWPAPIYMLAGILLGLFFGAVPGLGGNFTLSVLIPFIFGMEPRLALSFLLGAHAPVATGGSITAVLLNTPGSGMNAATVLDGFPLTQKGQAGRALGNSLMASAVGGVFGALILGLSLPVMKQIVLAFGPPEFFMMALLGVAFIAVVGGGSLFKSLIAGCLGLLISLIGYDPITGIVRFNFGTMYLYDGIDLVPVVIGLFALAEMIELGVKGGSIQGETIEAKGGVIEGIKDVFRHWWLTLRCSAIGTVIGMIPGLGGDVACFLAYGHAVQTSKHPEKFGTGIVEGVIAPESANNAKEGGALIPTVGFGIPGSSGMAILLGAFLIIGIIPGPEMLTTKLDLTFTMVWIVALANIIGTGIALIFANKLVKIAQIRGALLIPMVSVIGLVGAYAVDGKFGDVIAAVIFGIIGYQMKKYNFSRAVLIIGLVLGNIAERNLQLSLMLYKGAFLFRPITFILLVVTIVTIIMPFIKTGKTQKGGVTA
ncbi:MAG TPA: tripartite tricarboxylate transporter permease [Thermoanaerobacterales bacterium]|nr:tripartite tricarboxylate transporter permease [Thermoanaerobacterales bacterium]